MNNKPPWGYTVNDNWRSDELYIPVISVKLKRVRKKLGLTQREFAKKIGWNINKYGLLEQGKIEKLGYSSLEEAYPIRFILALADNAAVNPYWMTNDEEESIYDGDPDWIAKDAHEAVFQGEGGGYAMFASPFAVAEFKKYRLWWTDEESGMNAFAPSSDHD